MYERIHTCHLPTHFLCLYWWIQPTLVRSLMIASVGGTHILFPVIFFPYKNIYAALKLYLEF